MPTKTDIQILSDFALTLADAAAKVTLKHFKQRIDIDNKLEGEEFDPVTIADRDSEAVIRSLITASYPDHGIIGEEHGTIGEGADYVWVLDPIDGTRAFISGLPTWGTLIALLYKGEPILGLIDQPYLKERYIGSSLGSTLNGTPISVRPCKSISHATISTTDPAILNDDERVAWHKLEAESRLVRYSLDCYAYAVLSAGFIDIVAEAGLKIYDMMALIPVIRGAGGTATNWDGGMPGKDGRLLAYGDASLEAPLLSLLKGI